MRRKVCIVSFRTRLIDHDNLWIKHYLDALTEAGILFDDSERFCKVEVQQTQVDDPALERTEITIEPMP